MPDTESQPMPREEMTPPTEELQTPTPAPEPYPSEQPSVFETKPAEPASAPVESPPTPETPISIEPQSQPSEPAQPHPRSFLQRAREKIQFRKKAKLEKIMTLAQKKRSIANDDVEKLLRVSDATATRYLAELVRQGRLKRNGVRGSAKYEPI